MPPWMSLSTAPRGPGVGHPQGRPQGLGRGKQSPLRAAPGRRPPAPASARWLPRPPPGCRVHSGGAATPPAGPSAACAGATATASAGATAVMPVPPTLPAPGSPPLLPLLPPPPRRRSHRPGRQLGELAGSRHARRGGEGLRRRLPRPRSVCRQMGDRLRDDGTS